MSLTNDLIFRENIPLRTAGEVSGTITYNSAYLVVEVIGGNSPVLPYPGLILSQSFGGESPEIRGTELILRRGKQLIVLLGAGQYSLKIRSETAIAKATVKVWEYIGFFEGGGGNGGTLPPETIRNLLLSLEGAERLDYSAIKNTPTISTIREGLESLTGGDRIDYSAIKNTPTPTQTLNISQTLSIFPGELQSIPVNLPSAGILRKIQTTSPARIRCYLNQDYATADLTRPSTTLIEGDHGCFFDLQTKADKSFIRNTAPPPVFYSDGENYLNVNNLSDSAESLTLILTISEILK